MVNLPTNVQGSSYQCSINICFLNEETYLIKVCLCGELGGGGLND